MRGSKQSSGVEQRGLGESQVQPFQVEEVNHPSLGLVPVQRLLYDVQVGRAFKSLVLAQLAPDLRSMTKGIKLRVK